MDIQCPSCRMIFELSDDAARHLERLLPDEDGVWDEELVEAVAKVIYEIPDDPHPKSAWKELNPFTQDAYRRDALFILAAVLDWSAKE